jgi:intracellular septation protein
LAQYDRRRDGQVDHRGRFNATMAAIQHRIQLMLQPGTNLTPFSHRQLVARQQQRRTHDGFAKLRNQQPRHDMVGYAYADGAALFVLQTPGRLARRLEQEGKGPWRRRLEQAKLPRLYLRVAADFGQIATYQGEVMVPVGTAQQPQALQRVGITDMAAQGITTIGGVCDQPATSQYFGCLANQSQLRVGWMQLEILAHRDYYSAPRNSARLNPMQILISFLPLLAFYVAYQWQGIYFATGVLMAAMVLATAVEWLRFRKVSPMQLLSTVLILVFGTATLLLRDPRFLKWKPSILMWLMAAAFLVSQWVGKGPLAQRFMQAAVPEGLSLKPQQWSRLNLAWVAYFALLGAANYWFAFHHSEATWVKFKVYGLTVALMAFAIGQALWLSRQSAEQSAKST